MHFRPGFAEGSIDSHGKLADNQRPAWLDQAHKKLDAAVFAAYGWDPTMSDEGILGKLLALNLERAASSGKA